MGFSSSNWYTGAAKTGMGKTAGKSTCIGPGTEGGDQEFPRAQVMIELYVSLLSGSN